MKKLLFPFIIEAVRQVFDEMSIRIKHIEKTKPADKTYQIIINVGLTGDIKGFLLFSLDIRAAESLVNSLFNSTQMRNEEEYFGPLHKATLGELANQISARAVMLFCENNIDCYISPPTIITGEKINSFITDLTESFSSNILGIFGILNIFFSIEKN